MSPGRQRWAGAAGTRPQPCTPLRRSGALQRARGPQVLHTHNSKARCSYPGWGAGKKPRTGDTSVTHSRQCAEMLKVRLCRSTLYRQGSETVAQAHRCPRRHKTARIRFNTARQEAAERRQWAAWPVTNQRRRALVQAPDLRARDTTQHLALLIQDCGIHARLCACWITTDTLGLPLNTADVQVPDSAA